MGYYSDVALALTAKGAKAMRDKLAGIIDSTQADEVMNAVSSATRYVKDMSTGAELLYWSHTKFYSTYKDVQFFSELMAELDKEEYAFVRIGEDDCDAETRGSFWCNPFGIGLCRTILMAA